MTPSSDLQPATAVDVSRTPCAVDFALLYALLQTGRFDLSYEKRAQDEMERLLLEHIPAELVSREHRLAPGDIPDFLIGGCWVIEAKGPRHQASAVHRQLERYAAHECVQGMILATARAMRMPPQIGGKPVMVLNLGRAWL